MANDLKDTLNLPKTDFPMRANLVGREPQRVSHWEKLDLYTRIQRRNAAGTPFVLHDGPPFTNGDVHIGTALNKTLKDITLRYRSMRGHRTPYVPGWDCHGLPIEQKVSREIQAKKETLTTAELRQRCDAFSETWIATQTKQFKRLGVLADWKNEYKTKAPAFEADILRTFAGFVEQGLVYRSKKPVYWSIPFETALAEAEIEYKDHRSLSIWVRFALPAAECARFALPAGVPASVVIWTTTPWTLPANLAIAVHPELDYVFAKNGCEIFVVAAAMLEKFAADCQLEGRFEVLRTVRGAELEGVQPRHPFIDRASPLVLADYVTTESGTGCVHTAPGHGQDDYQTGLRYKLEIYCPVADNGCYLDDGRVPADLVGLSTLETVEMIGKKRTSPANFAVLKKLEALGALVKSKNLEHSYPHCWRSKTPIIFRAVDQWFVALDKSTGAGSSARTKALAAIGNVKWVPESGEKRIRGAVEARPDWCISRQRTWGVPIPAFYDAQKNAYLDAGVIRAIAAKIAAHGSNFWYDATPAQLLEGVALPAGWPAVDQLTCGRDTLDVWIDSGSSHAATLKHQQGATQWPADLYLEGSDQHRGWFQSSLWTGVISHGGAPYKTVLTHGFIVGKDGKKISKSGQYEKPPTSDNYIAQYGADVIRLWIASQDFTEDIRVSDLGPDLKNPSSILNVVGEAYRLLRNTLRYQLSCLHDFDPAQHAVATDQLDPLDRWALQKTAELVDAATAAYEAYEYHRVYQLVNQFCSVTLSATYHDILKDRLYTFPAGSRQRRSSQTAIHAMFSTLVRLVAPVATFTADEAWSFGVHKAEYADDSVHLQSWPEVPAAWRSAELAAEFDQLLAFRAKVNEKLEALRQSGEIGKGLDAAVQLTGAGEDAAFQLLAKHRDSLAELFIVSRVELVAGPAPAPGQISIVATVAGGERCPRCWRWLPALVPTPIHGAVCPRCAEALPH